MRDLIELLPNGLIELRYTMTMDVAPQRRNAVDIRITVEVVEEAAVGALDDERRLGGVLEHRCEGMPDVIAVPLFKLFARCHVVVVWGAAPRESEKTM